MSDLVERIRAARTKLGVLQGERERLAATVSRLEQDLHDRERRSDVLKARVIELERENEVLRTVRPATKEGNGRSGTKERIDELVTEIDRCLELLKA